MVNEQYGLRKDKIKINVNEAGFRSLQRGLIVSQDLGYKTNWFLTKAFIIVNTSIDVADCSRT
jgi:hypothetical protein